MCELANNKFGGELSNKYSNIIGVQTSVYKPSASTDKGPAPAPQPAPQGGGGSGNSHQHNHDRGYDRGYYPSDIIYPYPYPYPYPMPSDLIPIGKTNENVEKTDNKSATPTTTTAGKAPELKLSQGTKNLAILVIGAAVAILAYKFLKK